MLWFSRLAAALAAGVLVAANARAEAPEPRRENVAHADSVVQSRAPRWLIDTVVRAAEATGVDPVYMLALADKESTFDYQAKAKTSSAVGLFQFIEGTWLQVLNAYGAKHGFGAAADAIALVGGRPVISNPEERQWILSLRQDPYLSAVMAGEMVKRSRELLSKQSGRALTDGDLYLAHLLGQGGASRLLKLIDQKPQEEAPKVFRAAAKANRSIFFSSASKRTRKSATVAEVQSRIRTMMEDRLQRYATLIEGHAGQVAKPDIH